MSIVFSSIEVINTLATGFLVGSSVWNPNGNGLKDDGVSVSVKGRRKKGHLLDRDLDWERPPF